MRDAAERISITGGRVMFLHQLSEHGILALAAPAPATRLAAKGEEVGEVTLGSAYVVGGPGQSS